MHSNNRAPASVNLLHKIVIIINDDDDDGDNNNGDHDDDDSDDGDGKPLLLHRICQIIHDITSIHRNPKNLQFKSLG